MYMQAHVQINTFTNKYKNTHVHRYMYIYKHKYAYITNYFYVDMFVCVIADLINT